MLVSKFHYLHVVKSIDFLTKQKYQTVATLYQDTHIIPYFISICFKNIFELQQTIICAVTGQHNKFSSFRFDNNFGNLFELDVRVIRNVQSVDFILWLYKEQDKAINFKTTS